MQELHRGLISYHSVLINTSALHVDYICAGLRRVGFSCDQDLVETALCSSPSTDPDLNFNCHLLELLNELIDSYANLEYQQHRQVSIVNILKSDKHNSLI